MAIKGDRLALVEACALPSALLVHQLNFLNTCLSTQLISCTVLLNTLPVNNSDTSKMPRPPPLLEDLDVPMCNVAFF